MESSAKLSKAAGSSTAAKNPIRGKPTASTSAIAKAKVVPTQSATRTAPQPSTSTIKTTRLPMPKPEEQRKVAPKPISKVQPGTAAKGKSATTTAKPAAQKLRNLNISGNPAVSNSTVKQSNGKPVTKAPAKAGLPQTLKHVSNIRPKCPGPVTTLTAIKKRNPVVKQIASTGAATAHPPSGTATSATDNGARDSLLNPIDDVYMDFNHRFSNAMQQLRTRSSTWTELLGNGESSKIPDTVQGDIRSALGKVSLLMESKFPQFGKLLYAYLCQHEGTKEDHEEPRRVLPSDLEGWWDGVAVQVEAVKEVFLDLETLRDNNWNEATENGGQSQQESVISSTTEYNPDADASLPPWRSRMYVNIKATPGLTAFLATKRRMLAKKIENVNTTSTDTENDEMAPVVNGIESLSLSAAVNGDLPIVIKQEGLAMVVNENEPSLEAVVSPNEPLETAIVDEDKPVVIKIEVPMDADKSLGDIAIKNEPVIHESEPMGNSERDGDEDTSFSGTIYFYNAPQSQDTPDVMVQENDILPTSVTTAQAPEGFLSAIAHTSAARKSNRRSSNSRLSTRSEESLRRASLCILKVRKSAGSLMKLSVPQADSEDIVGKSCSSPDLFDNQNQVEEGGEVQHKADETDQPQPEVPELHRSCYLPEVDEID